MNELILHLPDPDGSATHSPPQLLNDPLDMVVSPTFNSFDYPDMPRDYRSPPTIFSESPSAAAGSPEPGHSCRERDLGAGLPCTNGRDGPHGADGRPPGGDGRPPEVPDSPSGRSGIGGTWTATVGLMVERM